MIENKSEVLVGGLVVGIAIAFTIYVLQVAGISTGASSYKIHAAFRSAEGVTVGTDVRLAGVKIGTVTALSLDSETYKAQSTMAIDQDVLIPDDSALAVTSEGLLGGNFVEVVPGASFDYLAAGDEIVDTQGSISLLQLMMRFVSSGEDK
jgi:phospholipid/cholesterol/gamma-HCH transport system substrate-binding protein